MSEENVQEVAQKKKKSTSLLALFVSLGVIIALGLGFAAGAFVAPHLSSGGFDTSLVGKTTVDEAGLSSVMGVYTIDGERHEVTVRDAIEESTSLDSAKNADGSYDVPSVDAVLSIARNDVLTKEAENRGLTATEQDAMAYAVKTLGTQDFAEIAAGYSMSQEQAVALMTRSALLDKLREQVVTTTAVGEPAAPPTVEAGKENEPQPQYATYILSLIGDEWNANANTWAREDGPYRQQLKDYTISNESATYAAAQAAYYVARAQYSKVQQQVSTEWTDYVNTLLANVSVELVTLVA